jgi:uncharacterized protein (DUF433 family)
MVLAIKSEPLPLRQEPDGTVRVGETRVLLDVIIGAFRDGASAEHIVEQYPSLDLADVYAVIAYYLKNTQTIDAYLEARRSQADALRVEIEANCGTSDMRQRVLARREAMRKQRQQP